MNKKILCIVGTRPEAIKMAPVIQALQRQRRWDARVVATAQHRELLDEALAMFDIVPDIDLGIMQPGQQLAVLTSRLIVALDRAIEAEQPAAVIAQGDTTSVFASAIAAFYRRTPFCHVEAGLRTGDMNTPFPEEMNRVLTGRLATLHFAATARARTALLREGVNEQTVFLTGNTVIDALLQVSKKEVSHGLNLPQDKKIVLLTAHRRENFGPNMASIFGAIRDLVMRHQEIHVVYPVHPNPNVIGPAHSFLGNTLGVTLCPPLDYERLIALMKKSWVVLTDSGGLQEEAPALAKPVLVLREETERPEAIEAGVAKLVGHDHDQIISTVETLLSDETTYRAMACGVSPYGDGQAAKRIENILFESFFDNKRAQQTT